jgi:hypothetical protein
MTAPENTRERVADALEREYGCKAGYVHEGYGSECASSAHAPGLYRTFGCDHVVRVADALLPLIDTLLREQAEGIAAAIEAARDRLHPAFSEGVGNLPRGYTNAARIVRTFGGER